MRRDRREAKMEATRREDLEREGGGREPKPPASELLVCNIRAAVLVVREV